MINKLLFLVISNFCWGEAARACSCMAGALDQMRAHPKLAATAVIGRVTNSKDYGRFQIQKSWTQSEGEVSLAAGNCAQLFEAGQPYLVLSNNHIDEIKKKHLGFSVCNSIVYRGQEAAEVIKKLELRNGRPDGVAKKNPETAN